MGDKAMKGTTSRWHRFDAQGNKQVRVFGINEIPDPLKEPCYTEWCRGNGPFSEEGLASLRKANSAAHKGVPKSEEQRAKMRAAKLGVPKTEAHRKAMSAAHMGRAKSEAHRQSMIGSRKRKNNDQ
jgi:hypothetical protein